MVQQVVLKVYIFVGVVEGDPEYVIEIKIISNNSKRCF
jgi:hypothetical protein